MAVLLYKGFTFANQTDHLRTKGGGKRKDDKKSWKELLWDVLKEPWAQAIQGDIEEERMGKKKH